MPLLSYDELYPAGEGRQIIEKTCIRCHGPDFLPGKQWDADQWNAAIDLMLSTAPNSNPPGRISEASVPGLIPPHDRQVLVDYLVKNFGPDSKPRGLAVAGSSSGRSGARQGDVDGVSHSAAGQRQRTPLPRRAPQPERRCVVCGHGRVADWQDGSDAPLRGQTIR